VTPNRWGSSEFNASFSIGFGNGLILEFKLQGGRDSDVTVISYAKNMLGPGCGIRNTELALVPGPARVGFRAAGGTGNRHPSLILCDLLGCRGERLRGIYTSSCKKAVINVSHSMSGAPPDQPHSPPEQLSSNSMFADGHAVSSNVLTFATFATKIN
jgi:hypothetical protein